MSMSQMSNFCGEGYSEIVNVQQRVKLATVIKQNYQAVHQSR